MNDVVKFIKKFQECVKEYRRQQRETTGDDSEIDYFYSNNLKKWLLDHEEEVIALSALNCEKPFMTFVTHYIYK